METKAKHLLQNNIPFDLNFEVKAFSKYRGWIKLAVFIIKCLLAAVAPSSAVKQFKHNHIQYPDSLCIFRLYVAHYFLSLYSLFKDFIILAGSC